MDGVAFQVFGCMASTTIYHILAELYQFTILDLLAFLSSWQVKVSDHVQIGDSWQVVDLVLLAELVKFGAKIDFYFNTVSLFAFDHEWFLCGLLVCYLLLDLLQICYQVADSVHRSVG
jgi:hypothetical protein